MIDFKKAYKAYRAQADNCNTKLDAAGNPVEMRMTFSEWIMVWIESGKWAQRGIHRGEYCMARYNDIGHYEVGNVRIITNAENVREARSGKPRPLETREKISASQKGVPKPNWTEERRARQPDTSGENNPFFGKSHTEEARQKNRDAHLGIKMSEESSVKKSAALKGKPWSEARRAAQEAKRKGEH